MTKLTWGNSGERFYEAGVDRGVLYPRSGSGVAWSGLVAVEENPSGGEPESLYLDGLKYYHVAKAEEFSASISAFSAPKEFDLSDGIASMANGLYMTQQPRAPFDFSYRTMVGNDTLGLDYGYKIHIVYNALSSPSQLSRETLAEDVSPLVRKWDITTRALATPGYRASAHFVIDARHVHPELLEFFEQALYGTDVDDPYLMPMDELISRFVNFTPFKAKLLLNGRWEASGDGVSVPTPASYVIENQFVENVGNGNTYIQTKE